MQRYFNIPGKNTAQFNTQKLSIIFIYPDQSCVVHTSWCLATMKRS